MTIPNELTGEVLALGTSTGLTLGITNVVNGVPYVFPSLTNSSGSTVTFAIARGGSVQCLGSYPTSSVVSNWGYYQLSSQTEFRIYLDNASCSQGGYYLRWDNTQISGFEINSGLISLSATFPPIAVASLAVSPNAVNVQVGQTQQLTATPKSASGAVLGNHPVAWSSSNTGVATVNSSGLVTAAGIGNAIISASSFGFTAGTIMSVSAPTVNTVSVCDLSITTGCRSLAITTPGQTATARAGSPAFGPVLS